MDKVYIVGLHDGSWGNHGDYIVGVFTDEELAQEQADWLEANLHFYDGDDYVTFSEYDIQTRVDKRGKGAPISSYLYGTYEKEEEEEP